MTFLISVAALVIVLGVLIFVHEAGHFLAAKAAGIYVHRFSLGLGAPVKGLTFKRGETEYVISWLPIGGYVKMASREEDSASGMLEGGAATAPVPATRVFEAKPLWQRIIVILAGVTMNALFAWGVYVFLAVKNGEQVLPTTRVGRIEVAALPADAAGLARLEPGDSITAVNGTPVKSWNDVASGLQFASGGDLVISVAGKGDITVPVHADALEERIAVGDAILPWQRAVVGQVLPGTPASRAGVEPGDTIVAIDGTPIEQWYDMVSIIQKNPGRELQFELGRASGRTSLAITPRNERSVGPDGESREVGQIGIGQKLDVVYRRFSFREGVAAGTEATLTASTAIVRSLRGIVTRRISGRSLGGPIQIGQMAGQSIQLGLDPFLAFMALISINLAILNLLPIPVLDGGQLVFLVAEGLTRRPLSLRLRERLTAFGLVVIVLLMVFAFSNDILRLFGI
ncbi:MAG: RIP metalloprotease RseP [Gemmatimonadales bacterium]